MINVNDADEEGQKTIDPCIIDQKLKERKKQITEGWIWNAFRKKKGCIWNEQDDRIYTWIARFFLKSASAWDWKSAAPIVVDLAVAAIIQGEAGRRRECMRYRTAAVIRKFTPSVASRCMFLLSTRRLNRFRRRRKWQALDRVVDPGRGIRLPRPTAHSALYGLFSLAQAQGALKFH